MEWLGAEDNPGKKGWAVPGKGYGGSVLELLAGIMAQAVPEAPGTAEETPKYPAYQTEGLARLAEAGVIDSPEVWKNRLGDPATVGQMFGILGKLLAKVEDSAS